MKTSQKIWCEPISARKWTSKKWPAKTELEISEISKLLILALYWNRKLRKLRNISILVNSKECVLLEEVGNFQGFQIFHFGPCIQIKNLENLGIFTTFVSSKECVLLEEVGNFQGFRVFDFGHYTKIENSGNSEIFTTLVNSKECVLL